jgi:hypothetical protein
MNSKGLLKTIGVLTGIIIALVIGIIILSVVWFQAWITTYRAFTQKELVAVIETSDLKYNGDTPYFELTYSQVVSGSNEENPEYEFSEKFTIQGDRFEVGGEFIKWHNWLTLIGVDPAYKVSRVEGDYSDIDLENSKPHTAFELNGGVDDSWRVLQNNEETFSWLVDSVFISFAGKFVEEENQRWGLYVTEDAFIIDRI